MTLRQKGPLAGLLVALAVLPSCGGLFGEDPRSAAFLTKVAAEITKQLNLPKMIDSETELTTVSGSEGVIAYGYRLVNHSASEIDAGTIANLKAQVAKNVCSTPETRDKFLKQRITMRYTYGDKGGAQVASFDITEADCTR
jgi:hypothetical protein